MLNMMRLIKFDPKMLEVCSEACPEELQEAMEVLTFSALSSEVEPLGATEPTFSDLSWAAERPAARTPCPP